MPAMPNHISTIEVSAEDMARGAQLELYGQRLAQWRAGEISDDAWEQMRREDPEFSRWLWQMGAP